MSFHLVSLKRLAMETGLQSYCSVLALNMSKSSLQANTGRPTPVAGLDIWKYDATIHGSSQKIKLNTYSQKRDF